MTASGGRRAGIPHHLYIQARGSRHASARKSNRRGRTARAGARAAWGEGEGADLLIVASITKIGRRPTARIRKCHFLIWKSEIQIRKCLPLIWKSKIQIRKCLPLIWKSKIQIRKWLSLIWKWDFLISALGRRVGGVMQHPSSRYPPKRWTRRPELHCRPYLEGTSLCEAVNELKSRETTLSLWERVG